MADDMEVAVPKTPVLTKADALKFARPDFVSVSADAMAPIAV